MAPRFFLAACLFALLPDAGMFAQQPQDTTYAPSACPEVSLPSHADRIDTLVIARMRGERIPAVQLALLERGQLSARAYGYADLQHCVPADTGSVFGLGSVSKQLTAYATLRAVQSGKISLSDSITKYLPEAKGVWDGITIRHLLSHTSGIRDYAGDDPTHPQTRIDSKAEISADSVIKVFAGAPLNFPPGTEMAYSNTGYKMLSILLERALAKPFPDVMRTLVYEPLGMRSTIAWDPSAIVPKLAYGYMVSNGKLLRGRYSSISSGRYGGDFYLLSTASDMVRFAAELIHPTHVSADLLAQMTTRAPLNDGATVGYGFGIQPTDVHGVPTLQHGGTWSGGYTAFDEIQPTRGFAIALLTNSWDAQPWALAAAVVEVVQDSLHAASAKMPADANPNRTARVRALLAGDSSGVPLTPAFVRHRYAFIKMIAGEMMSHVSSFSFRGCDDLRGSSAALPAQAISECYYHVDMEGREGLTMGVYFTKAGAVADIQPKF